MNSKPASLGSFIASKANAAPSLPSVVANDPVTEIEAPAAAKRGPKPKAKTEPMVPVNLMVPKSYRAELKKLAANHETTVTEIIKKGIELYRLKYR